LHSDAPFGHIAANDGDTMRASTVEYHGMTEVNAAWLSINFYGKVWNWMTIERTGSIG